MHIFKLGIKLISLHGNKINFWRKMMSSLHSHLYFVHFYEIHLHPAKDRINFG